MHAFSPAVSILVVDECESICELIELLLVRVGYHVRTATTGADSLRLAREMPSVDVLLCGLELPDMPGEEVAVGISAVHPATSVVYVGSSYGPNDGTGPVDVLEKPFSILELRNAVRAALQVMPGCSGSMFLGAG